MNDQDQIIERIGAAQAQEQERTNSICSAAWRKVRDAHPEVLARATVDAWQLEAIHSTRARARDAAKAAMRTWLTRVEPETRAA